MKPMSAEEILRYLEHHEDVTFITSKMGDVAWNDIASLVKVVLRNYALHLTGVLPEKKKEEDEGQAWADAVDTGNFDDCFSAGVAIGSEQGFNKAISDCRSAILKEAGIEPKE